MPELPEVETIRRDLRKKILRHTIRTVEVYRAKSVGGEAVKLKKILVDNTFTNIERRGKLLIFSLQKCNYKLLVHLKMTGQLIYEHERKGNVEVVAGGHKLSEHDIENLPNGFTRVAFVFANGGELFFNDLRVFGYLKLADENELQRALAGFGPEPLEKEFTEQYFFSLFKKNSHAPLKALLLNQELIAGLGNIYVDEACFCAGVKPNRPVGKVTLSEQKKLYKCIPVILREAIENRGTTFRNFVDADGHKGNYTDFLRVYGRTGKPCRKCKTPIKKTRVAGRGTHFCSSCQH